MLNLINQSNDFSNLVKDPTIKLDDLSNVINTITETYKFDKLFKNFLSFLIKKRRFFLLNIYLKVSLRLVQGNEVNLEQN